MGRAGRDGWSEGWSGDYQRADYHGVSLSTSGPRLGSGDNPL
jgi:hypothetical protein